MNGAKEGSKISWKSLLLEREELATIGRCNNNGCLPLAYTLVIKSTNQ